MHPRRSEKALITFRIFVCGAQGVCTCPWRTLECILFQQNVGCVVKAVQVQTAPIICVVALICSQDNGSTASSEHRSDSQVLGNWRLRGDKNPKPVCRISCLAQCQTLRVIIPWEVSTVVKALHSFSVSNTVNFRLKNPVWQSIFWNLLEGILKADHSLSFSM